MHMQIPDVTLSRTTKNLILPAQGVLLNERIIVEHIANILATIHEYPLLDFYAICVNYCVVTVIT